MSVHWLLVPVESGGEGWGRGGVNQGEGKGEVKGSGERREHVGKFKSMYVFQGKMKRQVGRTRVKGRRKPHSLVSISCLLTTHMK